METWDQVREALNTTLPNLLEQTYLVVYSRRHSNFWIQFHNGGAHGLKAETFSDAYSSNPDVMSDKARDELLGLGWLPPREGARFYREWPSPAPFAEVAGLTTKTFEALGGAPDALEYEAWDANKYFPIPTLPIPVKYRPVLNGTPDMTVDQLRIVIRDCLREITGNKETEPDERGEFLYQAGSAAFLVRSLNGDNVRAQVYAPLIWDIGNPPDILEAVNEINLMTRVGRVVWNGEVMIASTECPVHLFTLQWLEHACAEMAALADHFDDELKKRFGGTSPTSQSGHSPGYL